MVNCCCNCVFECLSSRQMPCALCYPDIAMDGPSLLSGGVWQCPDIAVQHRFATLMRRLFIAWNNGSIAMIHFQKGVDAEA